MPSNQYFYATGETKAQFAWRLIRQCVKDAIDITLKVDMKELYVNHGVHYNRKIMHVDAIQQMILNKTTYVCVYSIMLNACFVSVILYNVYQNFLIVEVL